jgi:hypothetical protein
MYGVRFAPPVTGRQKAPAPILVGCGRWIRGPLYSHVGGVTCLPL